MARPALLIVDDREDFRMSARTLFELEGFDVVGVAEDGAEALSEVRSRDDHGALMPQDMAGPVRSIPA